MRAARQRLPAGSPGVILHSLNDLLTTHLVASPLVQVPTHMERTFVVGRWARNTLTDMSGVNVRKRDK